MPSVAEVSQKKGGDDARRKLQQIYTAEIGIRELTGRNDGPRVQEYLRYTGLSGNFSYCSAFVCFCLNEAGIENPKNAWAPALFPQKRVIWCRDALTCVSGKKDARHDVSTGPQTGDVFGIYFSELKRIAHCGFVDSWDGTWCITVEANTTSAGALPEPGENGNPIRAGPGEGVYRKKRLVKTIYKVADWVDPNL